MVGFFTCYLNCCVLNEGRIFSRSLFIFYFVLDLYYLIHKRLYFESGLENITAYTVYKNNYQLIRTDKGKEEIVLSKFISDSESSFNLFDFASTDTIRLCN